LQITWTLQRNNNAFLTIYQYTKGNIKITGPSAIIKGRSVSWRSSTGNKHNLYLNRTAVTDQGSYFCTATEEDTYLDGISPGVWLQVNGKLLITGMWLLLYVSIE